VVGVIARVIFFQHGEVSIAISIVGSAGRRGPKFRTTLAFPGSTVTVIVQGIATVSARSRWNFLRLIIREGKRVLSMDLRRIRDGLAFHVSYEGRGVSSFFLFIHVS
jgi:hypothetical protein